MNDNGQGGNQLDHAQQGMQGQGGVRNIGTSVAGGMGGGFGGGNLRGMGKGGIITNPAMMQVRTNNKKGNNEIKGGGASERGTGGKHWCTSTGVWLYQGGVDCKLVMMTTTPT
jgi:hypothetical protein